MSLISNFVMEICVIDELKIETFDFLMKVFYVFENTHL